MKVTELWIGHEYSDDDKLDELDADVFATFENGRKYAFTVETPKAIKLIMEESKEGWFYTPDLIVVKELKPELIQNALESIPDDDLNQWGAAGFTLDERVEGTVSFIREHTFCKKVEIGGDEAILLSREENPIHITISPDGEWDDRVERPLIEAVSTIQELDEVISFDETLGDEWGEELSRQERINRQLLYLPQLVEALVEIKNRLIQEDMHDLQLIIWIDEDGYFWVDCFNVIQDFFKEKIIFQI